MTITTMEELRAVPVGDNLGVGRDAASRRQGVWQRVEAGLHRNGMTLPLDAFNTEVSHGNVVHEAVVEMEAGGVYHAHGSRWTYLVLDRTVEGEGRGWWVARLNTHGFYDSITVRTEVPAPRAERPNWYDTALSMGGHLIVAIRQSIDLTQQLAAANERVQAAEVATRVEVGQLRDSLSAALLAYCGENHIKPEDPLVQIMRDNGLRAPAVTVPVTATVQGTVRTVVSQDQLAGSLPPGSLPWTPTGDSNQMVDVYFTKDVVVPVETTDGGCVCHLADWGQVQNVLRAEGIQTYSSDVVRRTCPRD